MGESTLKVLFYGGKSPKGQGTKVTKIELCEEGGIQLCGPRVVVNSTDRVNSQNSIVVRFDVRRRVNTELFVEEYVTMTFLCWMRKSRV